MALGLGLAVTLTAGLAPMAQAAPMPMQPSVMQPSMVQPGTVKVVAYRNCAILQKAYPHGVGKKGAVDKIGGTVKANRVKNFLVHDKLFAKNIKLDRDKDGVACEKK